MGQKLSKIKENFIFLVQNCSKHPKKIPKRENRLRGSDFSSFVHSFIPSFLHSFIRSFLNLRFVDEDSADEVGELADTLLAEHGMGRQWVGNGQVMGR